MSESQLPLNAYYSESGAVVFRKVEKKGDTSVNLRLEELEKQVEELKKLLSKN